MVARSDIGGIRTRFPFRLHRLRWLVSAGLVASALAPAQVALAAPAAHQVTVQVIDRLGKPVTGTDESPQRVVFAELAGARKTFEVKPINGVARISLPAGAYGVVTEIVTPRPGDPHSAESQAFAAVARLVVDRDRALTLDARQGKRLGFAVDRPDAVLHAVTINVVLGGWHNHFVGFRTEHNAPVYLVPAPAASPADLTLGVLGVLAPTAHATMADTYQYSLARITTGIPADATFRFNDDELATHRVHYGAGGLPTKGEAGFESSYLPGEDPQGWWLETPLPASRTHMLTSGRWKGGMFERPAHELDPGEIAQFVIGSERTYRAGEASEERWNQAVFSPALQTPVSSGVTRAGNTLSVAVDMLAPGFGDYGSQVPFGSDVLSGSTTLSRGGTVIGRTEQAGSGTFTVPASTEKYTLAVQSRRLNPDTPLASKTDARWTFRSGRSGSGTTVLPLLSVRPSGPFDPLNRAPAGEPFPLTLDVAHQKGSTAPAITSVRLEVSFDDGRTWQSTGVTPGGMQTWRAMVTHPHRTATSGFVALRANAADDAGGTAQVTLLRAYKLA